MKKLQLIQQKNGQWRWRYVQNNKVMATSGGDGYMKWQKCLKGYFTVMQESSESTSLFAIYGIKFEVFSMCGNWKLREKIAKKYKGTTPAFILPDIKTRS